MIQTMGRLLADEQFIDLRSREIEGADTACSRLYDQSGELDLVSYAVGGEMARLKCIRISSLVFP